MVTSVGGSYRRKRSQPVDAGRIYDMLAGALGVHDAPSGADASAVVHQPFPSLALGSSQFRDRYLLKEVFRKYPDWNLGVDRRKAALDGFMKSEVHNVVTSERVSNRDYVGFDQRVREVYDLSCRKAISILGRFSWRSFADGCRFGPKASTGHRGSNAVLSKKLLSGPFHVTRRAAPILAIYMEFCSPGWAKRTLVPDIDAWYDAKLEAALASFSPLNDSLKPGFGPSFIMIREADAFWTAPKNAEIDRTILIQPDGNVLCQLGLGYCMRSRLSAVGINLNDQTVNQRLAFLGSLDGSVATVDVRDASNSLVEQVVWDHLGNHSWDHTDSTWWKLADALRTSCYRVGENDSERPHQLFSAMGNGFTFELESLIFYSLAHSTCVVLGLPLENVSVYGDDIIVPTEAIPLLRDVLSYAGFELNEAKSFYSVTGPHFRESCGKHYFGGVDVTPVYCSESLDDSGLILLHNNLIRWACAGGDPSGGLDGRLRSVVEYIRGLLSPRSRKTAIPFGEENDGLIRSFDDARPTVKTAILDPEYSGPPWRDVRGYVANTASTLTRGKSLIGDVGLTVWLYQKAFRKFQLPKVPMSVEPLKAGPLWLRAYSVGDRSYVYYQPKAGSYTPRVPPSLRLGWYLLPAPEEAAKPYKENTSKKVTLRYGKRVVRQWPDIGPWVTSE